jgi:hypothetical protein
MGKRAIIWLLVAALVGGIGFVYVQNRSSDQTGPAQTESDKTNAGDQAPAPEKESGEETPAGNQVPAGSKKSVSVTISQAGPEGELVVVKAYANAFEDGKCTAIFTKGSQTKTYTVNTEQQAQYTQCNPFEIPKSDFSSGTWKVAVTFESKSYKGTSDSWEFEL